MRRFNLLKSAATRYGDEETAPDPGEALPSRRRLFLLIVLLVVVAAFGVKNYIWRYVGRESYAPLPSAERVAVPLTGQVAGPAPAPTKPVTPVTPEPPAKASGPAGPAEPKLALPSSPVRGVQPQEPGEHLVPKAPLRGRFTVQVAAMAHEANARALRRKLEKLGYVVTIQKGRGSATQHVVLVAAPGDRSEADALVERLKAEGIPATVGESDGNYRVEAGRSVELDQAIDLAHELQKKGFTPKIASETGTTTLYLVRVGRFTSRGEASQRARELREKGFPGLIVKK